MQPAWRDLLDLDDEGRIKICYDPAYRRFAIRADGILVDPETAERVKRDGVIWLCCYFAEEKLLELLVTQAPDIARRFVRDALEREERNGLVRALVQRDDRGLLAAIKGMMAARFAREGR